MLKSKSFLAVDFGAANLKLAEFELSEEGGLRLLQYGLKSLGGEGMQESTREKAMLRGLQELLAAKPYTGRNMNICAPGFHVFSKFVKLPPVDTSKVTQIIQYEAQQNVPFPLAEVVWDYQILGATPTGELEVFLVAIKTDIVEGLFRVAETAGLRLQLADVSPAALCNSFRFNYGDQEGCTMLLDIGAKTSNLLFFEKGNVYSRGISIGAHSITQDFAKESKLSLAEAERIKIEEGFVSLGGAYEEPESPHQAAISKIARQVMTRLHIQVNQTIQFYRGQQGGSAPLRLFLSGGGSIMPYTAQFFSEKLNVPVDYFNPFRNIEIDPSVNLEELSKVAHSYGEVVGLGLRNLAHCPIELNLMPKTSLRRQQFAQKKPYIVATVFSLVMVVGAFGMFYKKMSEVKSDALQKVKAQNDPVKAAEVKLQDVSKKLKSDVQKADQYAMWLEDRTYWPSLLMELRRVMLECERRAKGGLGRDNGVWIENFKPILPEGYLTPGYTYYEEETPRFNPYMMNMMMMRRYFPGGMPGGAGGMPGMPGMPGGMAGATNEAAADTGETKTSKVSTNEITNVSLTFRAVSLLSAAPDANSKLVDVVEEQLKASPFFLPGDVKFEGKMTLDETNLTFSFNVNLKLKRPFKLL